VLDWECKDMASKVTPKIAENFSFFKLGRYFCAVIICICFIPLLLIVALKNGDKKSVFE